MCAGIRISTKARKKTDFTWVFLSVSKKVKKFDYNGLKLDFGFPEQ